MKPIHRLLRLVLITLGCCALHATSSAVEISFDTFTPGAGQLIADPSRGLTGFIFSPTGSSMVNNPLQGILATSPLGTGPAGYLGGGGDGSTLTLPAENTFVGLLFFPGAVTDAAANRITSGAPIRTASVDFLVDRNGGTNSQSFAFYIFDARDAANGDTYGYHSYVKIESNNSVAIADNSTALAAASYAYTPTGFNLAEDTRYRLTLTVNYTAATWSATIATIDGSASYAIAVNRSINTAGYVLSGWAPAGTLDVEMVGLASASNRAFADRLVFDNIAIADEALPAQAITFGALAAKTLGDAPFDLVATASSELPVTFEIVSGPATLLGKTVTLIGAGTVVVRALQAGSTTYGAAPPVERSFTVNKRSQTITFAALASKTFGAAPFTVSATASSGLTATYSIVSGPATISGKTVTLIGPGTVVVRAAQTGNATYSAATSVDRSFTVSKLAQTITFAALGTKIFGATPITLAATSSSGLVVTYTKVSGPATLSGNKLTLTGAGTVIVRAAQVGNATYAAATSVDRSITSIKSPTSATVTLGGLSTAYTGSTKQVTATTSPTGLPVLITYAGSSTAPSAAGSYTVVATVNEPNYTGSAASTTRTLVIAKATQTITFAGPGNRLFTAVPITLTATSSSGLPVTAFSVVSGPATISGNKLTLTGLGTVVLRATQAGNANYAAATAVDRSITVGKSAEMIYLSKARYNLQTTSTTVAAASAEYLPFEFWAEVDAGSGNAVRSTSAKLSPAPKLTLPLASTFKTATGLTPALGLGSDADDGWNFGYTGTPEFDNWATATKAQLDAYFPAGTYIFIIQGKSVPLTLPADSYPPAPVITLTGGSWSGGVYRIKSNQALTIGTGTYTAYGTQANNALWLSLEDLTTEDELFDYTQAAKPIAYYGLPTSANKSYSRTIAANTLPSGRRYRVNAGYIAVMTQSTPFPGCTAVVAYETETQLFIDVISP